MGRPKAMLTHPKSATFVEHVAEVARLAANDVVLVGTAHTIPESLRSLVMLPDTLAGAGPVAGLVAFLRYIESGWGMLLSCDMPQLEAELLHDLRASADDQVDAVAYQEPGTGKLHACCALYHTRALPAAAHGLNTDRSLQGVLRNVRTRVLRPSHNQRRQLANVNVPEDLEALDLIPRPTDSMQPAVDRGAQPVFP